MIGSIYMYAGSSAPTGFMSCDGSAISRETYADLFAIIGTTYGAGDGSTTFALPNLSGRVAMGYSGSYAIGATGGSETCTLVTNNLPSHTHQCPKHGHSHNIVAKTPSLSHTITQPAVTYSAPGSTRIDGPYTGQTGYGSTSFTAATRIRDLNINDHAATACSGSVTIANKDAFASGSSGSGGAHNNMQPFLTMMYIIQVTE